VSRALKVIGGLLAALITVLALTPEQWSEHLTQWRVALGGTGLAALCLLGGCALGVVGHRLYAARSATPLSSDGIRIISAEDYESEVRDLIKSEVYPVIKVLGYTGETVLTDLFRFDDRYRGNLEVRFLHRNWLVERYDESTHNEKYENLRPWKKSEAIRTLAYEDWEHPLRRQFRYYYRQPIVKGMILCKPRGQGRVAYVSFFQWVERPEEGGSEFKGTGMSLISLTDNTELGKNFIDNLESQFEYEWSRGAKVNEVEDAIELEDNV
jgi:hypothetical protein